MKLMTTMMKGMAITMMLKMDVRMMASLMIMSSNSMVVRGMEDGIEDALRVGNELVHLMGRGCWWLWWQWRSNTEWRTRYFMTRE